MPGRNILKQFLASRCVGALSVFLLVASPALLAAPVPGPEKLLPDDTLLVLTAPDFNRVRDLWNASPQNAFWNDAAMKPFRDAFLSRWDDEIVKPLQRELDVRLDDYLPLAQGQLTVALLQNGWQGREGQSPALLLLVDTKTKSKQAKANLAKLKKKWADSGKASRTEKIRDFEFSVLTIGTNDLPAALSQFIPRPLEVQELGPDGEVKKTVPPKNELVLGQLDSLLVVGTSLKAVEKIVVRFTGGELPALGDQAAYQANQTSLFRDCPAFGWLNVKMFFDVMGRKDAEKQDAEGGDTLGRPRVDKLLAALGLNGIKSAACALQCSNEGAMLQFFLTAPESGRQGLLKIFAGEPKDCGPPQFVPADVAKFQRWRFDGQKTWATVEKMLTDFDPRFVSSLGFVIDTAAARAKEKDPGFDLKKSLLTNLGDDILTYEKPAREPASADEQLNPSLKLISSPNPEELAVALKALFVIFPGADSATEREFLGRKIYSTPVPNFPLPFMEQSGGAGRVLSYAASGGYVALSTDASILEEYLRSSESQARRLKETAGLAEAAQKVTGPGTSLFGFENQAETIRASFEAAKKGPSLSTNVPSASGNSLVGTLGLPTADKTITEWMDGSLLPPFDKVAKYFSFVVHGGSATVDGLSYKIFVPFPLGLKRSETAAATK